MIGFKVNQMSEKFDIGLFIIENKDLLIPVVTGVFGAGLWGFLSKRLEQPLNEARTDELVVKGAATVVSLQQSLMEQLQSDLDRRVKLIEESHRQQLDNERSSWEQERAELKAELSKMSDRINDLENINQRLEATKCGTCEPNFNASVPELVTA